jgi:hypothetical protein
VVEPTVGLHQLAPEHADRRRVPKSAKARVERSDGDDGVRVEQKHVLAPGGPQAEVVRTRKPDVVGELGDRDAGMGRPHRVDGPVAGRVVQQEDLRVSRVRVRIERRQAVEDEVLAPVAHDDHRQWEGARRS